MKQRITVQQLNELSDKGREKLKMWVKEHDADVVAIRKNDQGELIKTHLRGEILLSIGQMIELICDREYDTRTYFDAIAKVDNDSRLKAIVPYHRLCDALWNLAKLSLERE